MNPPNFKNPTKPEIIEFTTDRYNKFDARNVTGEVVLDEVEAEIHKTARRLVMLHNMRGDLSRNLGDLDLPFDREIHSHLAYQHKKRLLKSGPMRRKSA